MTHIWVLLVGIVLMEMKKLVFEHLGVLQNVDKKAKWEGCYTNQSQLNSREDQRNIKAEQSHL